MNMYVPECSHERTITRLFRPIRAAAGLYTGSSSCMYLDEYLFYWRLPNLMPFTCHVQTCLLLQIIDVSTCWFELRERESNKLNSQIGELLLAYCYYPGSRHCSDCIARACLCDVSHTVICVMLICVIQTHIHKQYINFIDYEKAFDSLDRDTLWKLWRHYGIPEKIITIIQNNYQATSCKVLHAGQLSESFEVKTGVRQGCLLSYSGTLEVIMCTFDD